MVKKTLQYFGLMLLLAVFLVEGFFLNDYLRLRLERDELRDLVHSALDLADRRTGSIDACMASLQTCTRVIDYEHPRVFEHIIKGADSQHVAR